MSSVRDWELHGHKIKGRYFASDDARSPHGLLKAAAKWTRDNRNRIAVLDITFRLSEGSEVGDSVTVYYEEVTPIRSGLPLI